MLYGLAEEAGHVRWATKLDFPMLKSVDINQEINNAYIPMMDGTMIKVDSNMFMEKVSMKVQDFVNMAEDTDKCIVTGSSKIAAL